MKIFNFFKKKKELVEPVTTNENIKLSMMEEIFSSPQLLFLFVKEHVINTHNTDLDSDLINKFKKIFDISLHQSQLFLNERELIRVAGCLFYAKSFHTNDFYIEFKEYLLKHLVDKRSQFYNKDELDSIIAFYQTEGEPVLYTRHFLDRVFSESSIYQELMYSELILELTFNYFMFCADNLRKENPDIMVSGDEYAIRIL